MTPGVGVEPHGPVQDTMFRALGILRFVVLLNAIGIYLLRYENYDHPMVGWLVMVGLVAWTFFAVWAYAAPERRTPTLLVADLVVAVVAIGLSPYVKGEGLNATLPGFWVMGAVLAWAILWRWAGGLIAALVVSIADISIREEFTQKPGMVAFSPGPLTYGEQAIAATATARSATSSHGVRREGRS